MKPNMNALLKQAQKMQEDLQRVQEGLGVIVVEGTAGGGMVKVEANCKNEIISIKIEPEVYEDEDKEMLEDLITAAVNQALSNAQTRANDEMGKVTGGMMGGMPGGMKFPGF